METKPGLAENDALIERTSSKKTDVKGRLYLLTTGGLIGVGRWLARHARSETEN
jgi:hypothetical protein